MKHETHYSSQLAKTLETELWGSVVFQHMNESSTGIPDLSVTWHKRTTWLEVKLFHGGRLIGTHQQKRVLLQLSRAGLAWFVVFSPEWTKIVHPVTSECVLHVSGVDFLAIVSFIRRTHAA